MRQLLIMVLILSTLSLTAQDRRGHHGKRGDHAKGQFLKDLSPEESANLRTKHMALDLNLTDAQQREIYNLNLKQAENRIAKQEEREEKRADSKNEKPSKEDALKRMNERLDRKIAHKKDMQRILNEDQFQKWERSNKRSHQKRKMKRPRSRRSR
ncbi:MAG: DUF4890 domain-containing protein [Bacteroidia bacterium]|nr:DUF4890 domain-containing protein [Bacteroidia bacterium]NND51588.1 DUF4890 domain-containing protein [Flavobacteriaceae bacterium]